VPDFAGVRSGETDALIEPFAGEPELHHPIPGRVSGRNEFERTSRHWTCSPYAAIDASEVGEPDCGRGGDRDPQQPQYPDPITGSRSPLSWSLSAGPVREHEIACGHLPDISVGYAMGRMTPPAGFVEGDESATPQPELVGTGSS
jgi:hypothetical protein